MRIGTALALLVALALAWIRQDVHDARREAAARAAVAAVEQAPPDLPEVRRQLLAGWPDAMAWRSTSVRSVAVVGERLARAGGPDTLPPLGAVAATIRKGELPDEAVWATPGAAGLAALELGLRGDPRDRALLERAAVDGPTAEDRLAARYALTRLAP